jgi:hypothetical protein
MNTVSDQPPGSIGGNDQSFHEKYRLEEMRALRSEINVQLQEMYRIENFAVLAIGAVTSIVFLKSDEIADGICLFLAASPICIVAYCWVRARSIRFLISRMDTYLGSLERELPKIAVKMHGDEIFVHGWVDFYLKNARRYEKTEIVFWAGLMTVCFVLFGLYFEYQSG